MLSFKPLTWEDREPYTELFRRTSFRYSTYSFFTLWGWQETNLLSLAWANGLCWLRSEGYKPGYFAPVGDWDAADWNALFREHFVPGDVLFNVPEAIVSRFSPELSARVRLGEDRDEWEYLYSVSELIALKGNRFAQKRAHVRSFLNTYDWEYIPLLPEDFSELLALQAEWRRRREVEDSAAQTLDGEDRAIQRALEHWDDFPLLGALLRVDGTTVGYTIGEELDEKTLDIRFEKALSGYSGCYQALNQLFLQNQGANYEWVNREEDMGSPGLRKSKLSYHPVRLLKKYRVEILAAPQQG